MLSILIVEDDPQLSSLLVRALRRQYPGSEIEATDLIQDGYYILMEPHKIDLAIVDGELPDGRGAQLVESVIKSHIGPPFLGISGNPDEVKELCLAGCHQVLPRPLPIPAQTHGGSEEDHPLLPGRSAPTGSPP